MATKAVATRDHEEIRRWAEEHGGIPARVKGTGGLLRIDFIMGPQSGGREPTLEEIPWEEWFRIFDEQNLVFLHGTGDSRFFKLVYPDTLEQKQRRKSAAASRGRSARATQSNGSRRGASGSRRGSSAGRSGSSSGRRGAGSSRGAGAGSSRGAGAGSSSRQSTGTRGRAAASGSRSSGRSRADGSARANGSSRSASARGGRRSSGSRSAQASSSGRTARSPRGSSSRSSRKQSGRPMGDGGAEAGAPR